jgi:hypothetical protein
VHEKQPIAQQKPKIRSSWRGPTHLSSLWIYQGFF